ncbi:MAG: ABC transporter ATP-binding protein [Aerococcus sp.]|nr:ABC transporter ATP-binding protein [Aerococcus sp.]
MELLTVSDLAGGYSQRQVIKDLNFTVDIGEIVGLIGLNGAGKSTTMKHIIGLLTPIAGKIAINGQTIAEDNQGYHQALSYIPETPILYKALTLKEHLEMIGSVYGYSPEEAMERAYPLLEQFRLLDRLEWLPIHFSKGMKQKVMIICSLMTDADLYVIDEPFVGLDPLAIHDFIDLLEQKKAAGKGILLSTHILANAERYCDRFLFLKDGRLKAQGNLSEIQSQLSLPNATLDELYFALARGEHDAD